MASAPPPLEGYTGLDRPTDPRGLTLGDLLSMTPHRALMAGLELAGLDLGTLSGVPTLRPVREVTDPWGARITAEEEAKRQGASRALQNIPYSPLAAAVELAAPSAYDALTREVSGANPEAPNVLAAVDNLSLGGLIEAPVAQSLLRAGAPPSLRGPGARRRPSITPERAEWVRSRIDAVKGELQSLWDAAAQNQTGEYSSGVIWGPGQKRRAAELNREWKRLEAELKQPVESSAAPGPLERVEQTVAGETPILGRGTIEAPQPGVLEPRAAAGATQAAQEPGMGNLLPEGGVRVEDAALTLGQLMSRRAVMAEASAGRNAVMTAEAVEAARSRPVVDAVAWRENPPKLEGTGAGGKVTKEDVARATAGPDISHLPYDEQVRLMADQGAKEVAYQSQQRRSGEGWYQQDIREYEHAATTAFPELKDPEMMGLFKAVTALTSFGNKPKENAEIAFNLWEQFRDGFLDFPAVQRTGSYWPGGPGFGTPGPSTAKGETFLAFGPLATSRGKLYKIKQEAGGWNGVVRWLMDEHPVGELRALGFDVSGKATDMKPGAYAFGPKGGPFFRNLQGILDDFTGDMWVARTMNRLRGTPFDTDKEGNVSLPDVPRNDAERKLFRDVALGIAERLGGEHEVSGVQAMHWFHEKDLWGKLMGGEDFGTYSTGGRLALESMRQKRDAGTIGTSAKDLPVKPAKLPFEIVFGEGAPLRQQYDWASQPVEVQQRITDEHSRWVAEEVELETGATLLAHVSDTGPKNWGANPNAVVRMKGTPGQIRAAALMLGLGEQQTSVPIISDGGATPGIDVIRRGGSVVWDRSFGQKIRDGFDERAPGMMEHIQIELNISPNNEPMVKAYGIDDEGNAILADPKRAEKVKKILAGLVEEHDPGSNPLARKGFYDIIFPSNDWTVDRNGETYRRELESLGYSPEGLDSFVARVSAAFEKTWGKHSVKPARRRPRRSQAVASPASPSEAGLTLGQLMGGGTP